MRPVMSAKQQYQLARRRERLGVQYWGVPDGKPEGSSGGFLLSGQEYKDMDCLAVISWLYDRARGYPKRALPWPASI